jgi:hypothetical protein
MGYSSLNAEVNEFERLQIVRDRNSSYFGSTYRSWTVRARCFGASSLPSTRPCFYLLPHGSKLHCIQSTPSAMQSISENDFECFASTAVNTIATTFSDSAPRVQAELGH